MLYLLVNFLYLLAKVLAVSDWTTPEPDEPTFGPARRTRSQISKGAAAKGANGEREVLSAIRDVMRNVEEALSNEGLAFVARSDFTTRKRIEAGTSNRDLGNVPIVSIEVKRQEALNVGKAWEQAVRQAEPDALLPVLVYRYNREPWRVRTWLALTSPWGEWAGAVVGEISLPDFLAYYGRIYRAFLARGLR